MISVQHLTTRFGSHVAVNALSFEVDAGEVLGFLGPMGIRAIPVVKTSNPNTGSVVRQDILVVRPGTTTAAELWF